MYHGEEGKKSSYLKAAAAYSLLPTEKKENKIYSI